MRWARQLCLNVGRRRQKPPTSLQARLAAVKPVVPRPDPPRAVVAPALSVKSFVWQCTQQGTYGARDLRELKRLFDGFCDSENFPRLSERELAEKLTRLGIAHGYRDLEPYESGYERAVLETELDRPRVAFFIMPPAFPIERPFQRRRDLTAPETPPRQEDLFAPPDDAEEG